MLSITLSYAIDGTNIANLISKELSDSKPSWKFNRYPLINKNDISQFCSSISNGTLKTDIIIFICTDDFYENNCSEIDKLQNISEHTKYRFSWIRVGRRKKYTTNISYDIEIAVDDVISCTADGSEEKHNLLSQVANYLQLVDITIKRQKEYKEQQRKKKQKFYNLMIPLCIAYVGIITSAISVMQLGESNHFKSSAELLLIFTGFITAVSFLSLFGFVVNNRRKRIQEKESSDFDRELNLSLSNSSLKDEKSDKFIDITEEIVRTMPFPSSEALDLIFSINKLQSKNLCEKNDDSEYEGTKSKRKSPASEDTEIAKAIGDNSYLPLGHLKFNWKQMKGYYDISKKQAKTSFGWAISISFIGILLIVFAILSPLIPCFRTENSLIPIVGSIGGAVVELFAGTILVVYIKSLSQMNLYHKALSEYQRYLSCINLVTKISSLEKQDQLYEDIIREEMKKGNVDSHEQTIN